MKGVNDECTWQKPHKWNVTHITDFPSLQLSLLFHSLKCRFPSVRAVLWASTVCVTRISRLLLSKLIPPLLLFLPLFSHQQGPLTTLVKRTLTISNPNVQPVAFKVKTTAPKVCRITSCEKDSRDLHDSLPSCTVSGRTLGG